MSDDLVQENIIEEERKGCENDVFTDALDCSPQIPDVNRLVTSYYSHTMEALDQSRILS